MEKIEKELKGISQELKNLNQHLGAIAKMMEDYMYHKDIYTERTSRYDVDLSTGNFGVRKDRRK